MKENVLTQIDKQAKKLWEKEKELIEQAKEYCENKKFKIVKPIYYAGYQNNLQGRECYIHPYIDMGQLIASCTIYNKVTKRIDISHYYGHDMSFYEEISE